MMLCLSPGVHRTLSSHIAEVISLVTKMIKVKESEKSERKVIKVTEQQYFSQWFLGKPK
jgi:hypothetical protein